LEIFAFGPSHGRVSGELSAQSTQFLNRVVVSRSPSFPPILALRDCEMISQFPNGIVSSVSFVSTANTARSLAGFVSLALALRPWGSPGS
jgi:hypothetical protein